ncbi:MAG TPA: hypothetical protein VGI63_09815 [Verrucomicrobiae bacterium]
MKKITIAGLLIVLIVVGILLHWRNVTIPKFDRDFRQHLAGAWLRQETNMRCTNTVAADGSFVELSWFSHSDRTNTYRHTGTWIVKNGHLIETVKTSTNPSEVTPHTGTARILHANARGFTLRWQNSNESAWQKIIQ